MHPTRNKSATYFPAGGALRLWRMLLLLVQSFLTRNPSAVRLL
jgi:hypothetical protein